MFVLKLEKEEYFDENTNSFFTLDPVVIRLEHSLVSLSKWESKWKKPFLSSEKTNEEMIDYIRCMTISQNVPENAYYRIDNEQMRRVIEYIEDPMTATWFSKKDEQRSGMSRETVTSELIYYWMISLQIPVEFQKWHLNRLITLIKLCGIKNAPPKKMSRNEIMKQNSAINARNRARMNSRG